MTKSEHLLFLALMIPTVLLLALATVSLAIPDPDFAANPPALQLPPQVAMDDAGHETAY